MLIDLFLRQRERRWGFRSIRLSPHLFFLLFGTLFLPLILCANHDTLYICNPGEALRLQADTSFSGYSWFPTTGLSNPTIADPVAMPLVTTTYIVESIGASGPNLITNGDFSQGNQGFSSEYRYSPGANPTQGVYGVFPDANNLSPQYFSHCRDQTTGQGNLMAVDGSPQANVKVWCQSVAVAPNTVYGFSTWVTSIYPPNPARLQFSINGLPLAQPFNAGSTVCQWRQFYATWISGQTTEAEICIVNQNTDPNGNDFALDDFSFFKLGEVTYDTFTVIVENIAETHIDTAVCAGSFVEYNGVIVEAGRSAVFRLPSIRGCDSLVELSVGVLDTIFEYVRIDTLCPGEIIDFFGHSIDRDTIICETFAISSSCDSTYCLTAVYLTETALETEAVNPACSGATDGRIAITPKAGLPPYSFRWNSGEEGEIISGLSSGAYSVQVTDAKGCTAVRQVVLEEPPPLVSESVARSKLCNGQINGILELRATGGTSPYEYSLDEGVNFQTQPILQNLPLGTYSILVRDANNCEVRQPITLPQPLIIELYPPPPVNIPLGQSVYAAIQTNTEEQLAYVWSPEKGVACSTCPETEIFPLQNTRYTIVATDPDGCRWEANWPVQVYREPDVYIPNAFSPNGDGQNDFFRVYAGPSVDRMLNLQIFDRWGNLLFQVKDCMSDKEICRWDGLYYGASVPEGVYVYLLTIAYIDGETERFAGELILIR